MLLVSSFTMDLEASPKIIRGSSLEDGQIPQMQTLWISSSPVCTATLIGPRTIITAAHCAHATSFGPSKTKQINVKFIKHPRYIKKIKKRNGLEITYDVAVGILENSVSSISPISVTSIIPSVGSYILFAGIGKPKPGIRQYGFVEIIKISPIGLTSRGIGNKKQIASRGDSGGPNFIRNIDGSIEIFAVTSTSTERKKYTKRYGKYGKPYTMGSALIFPRESKGIEVFLNQIAKQEELDICGVNLACPPVLFE